MKRFPLFLILFGFSLFAQQNKPVAEKIAQFHQENQRFESFNLFDRNPSVEKQSEYKNLATDAVVLELNSEELQRLMNEMPETIQLSFPYKEGQLSVELFRKNILTEGFIATDQNSKEILYEPGIYYRGIVENDPTSIVAFSFFDQGIMGVASALGTGNVVIGKVKDGADYLSYTDYTLTTENSFRCGVEEIPENQGKEISFEPEMLNKNQMDPSNCVRIYYEIAYQPYLENGSDTTATLNWITGIQNNISTLYANDNVLVALNDVLIWTEEDPFVYDFSGNLDYFRNYRTAFNGDLAHLVNSPSTTSVAYLNSLCSTSRYAYSGINQYYEEVPTYSWTIMAMTHEMGHSLGSPHTHACAWNGDNTAIDGCGPEAGYDEGCDAPLPLSGTIMSYCHLVSGVGVNLANGFGLQPAALIQNMVNSKSCLGTDCVVSCIFSVIDIEFDNVTTTSADIVIEDEISDGWYYQFFPVNGSPTTWTESSSNTISMSGLQPNSYYIINVKNICTAGSINAEISRMLLTDGEYCSGDLFVDAGGQNGNYMDGVHVLEKTFYPEGNTHITLTFTVFDLEDGYDFMTIYDGENTDAPIFENGENLTGNSIPGSFVSTNLTGAITVKFVVDPYMTASGWEANIVCTPLAITDFTALQEIFVYPNPTRSNVHIESSEGIEHIKVYTILGELVKEMEGKNRQEVLLNLEDLSKGVYFLQVQIGTKVETIKLLKE